MASFPPKGPWDDLRREVEKILGLPPGSTDPRVGFPPLNLLMGKLVVKVEDLLIRRN